MRFPPGRGRVDRRGQGPKTGQRRIRGRMSEDGQDGPTGWLADAGSMGPGENYEVGI